MTPPGGEKLRRALLPAIFVRALRDGPSASGAPRLSMDDDNAERTVRWRCREWKCESWVAADGRKWLELYQGVRVALARPVRDAEQLQALADSWRDALAETYPEEIVMPEPTRRRLGPRRH